MITATIVKSRYKYQSLPADYLLVIGTASSVWDELSWWSSTFGYINCHVMAINDMCAHYPYKLDHCVSLHPKLLIAAKLIREARLLNTSYISHTIEGQPDANEADLVWTISGMCGSSAMFACILGIKMKYKKIILAGCPLDCSGHFFSKPGLTTHFGNSDSLKLCWSRMKAEILLDSVRSMSGWSMELLGGPPTEKWLEVK
jgi:hypothetical protein